MSQEVLSGKQFAQPITEAEARGNSRPVSHEEFQRLAQRGHERLQAMSSDRSGGSTRGLDEHWPEIKQHAYQEAKKPWGGVTVEAATGRVLPQGTDQYALTARLPGQPEISIHEHAGPEDFGHAMDRARAVYPQLSNAQHHLGVFHDDEKHSIDIDPVVVVDKPEHADEIGAATHAVGGAFHFKTGNAHWVPHVRGT